MPLVDLNVEKLELFSAAWAAQAELALQNSLGYQKAAVTWEGTMVFTLSSPNLEPRSVFFDLWHGECRLAKVAEQADLENAQYIIAANSATWQEVLGGKLEPIAALLRGKLKLSKGNIAVLVRHVPAAKELVLCASSVPTLFL